MSAPRRRSGLTPQDETATKAIDRRAAEDTPGQTGLTGQTGPKKKIIPQASHT